MESSARTQRDVCWFSSPSCISTLSIIATNVTQSSRVKGGVCTGGTGCQDESSRGLLGVKGVIARDVCALSDLCNVPNLPGHYPCRISERERS